MLMDTTSCHNHFAGAFIVQYAAFPLHKGNGVNPAKVESAATQGLRQRREGAMQQRGPTTHGT